MHPGTFYKGMKKAAPIVLGYLPIGITYGILAVQSGISPAATVFMSILVFAGSSQLMAVNMVALGTSLLPVIAMTFLVNLRHILMSASFSLHFQKTNRSLLPVLGFVITDESFAVGSVEIKKYKDKNSFFLGLGITAYIGWVFSSFLGAILASQLPVLNSPIFGFVLPAMFIVLLVMQIKNRMDIFVAVIAGLLSLFIASILPGNWNVIMATIIAATLGVIIERWI